MTYIGSRDVTPAMENQMAKRLGNGPAILPSSQGIEPYRLHREKFCNSKTPRTVMNFLVECLGFRAEVFGLAWR